MLLLTGFVTIIFGAEPPEAGGVGCGTGRKGAIGLHEGAQQASEVGLFKS